MALNICMSELVSDNVNEFTNDFHTNILQSYMSAATPHAVNTAWAMLALIDAGQVYFCSWFI